MRYKKAVFVAFSSLVASMTLPACENIGKRTVFNALQEQSKYDCGLAASNECPRSPEVYDEYERERKQAREKQH